MLSITDNHLYVIDSDGHQQLFDVDKLKRALQEAFDASGNPNGYLSEDIACAVEAAMAESHRMERIFTQSEVDAAVSRILENAGCANTAAAFRRANSHLYIALDAVCADVTMLISRHLGVDSPVAEKLASQVVEALNKLNIASASPALYLELARYYEHRTASPGLDEAMKSAAAGNTARSGGKKDHISGTGQPFVPQLPACAESGETGGSSAIKYAGYGIGNCSRTLSAGRIVRQVADAALRTLAS